MDKGQLNLEIILCRALVKRARVCVVRKLLKQIKILRSTKNEKSKEKRFRKARRLVAEIHVMKMLRPDYVTKFALVTENYVSAGSNTKLKRKRNACAKIAKHRVLMAKINAIRNKFINWREELPPMLKSAKKKKAEEEVTGDTKIECNKVDEESEQCKVEDSDNASEEADEISENELKEPPVKVEKYVDDNTKTSKKSDILKPNIDVDINKGPTSDKSPKVAKSDNVKNVLQAQVKLRNTARSKVRENRMEVEKASNGKEEEKDDTAVEEKIDDPFFLDKKIIVPKLLQKGSENHPENDNVRKNVWNVDVEQEPRAKKKRDSSDEREQELRLRKEKRMEKAEAVKRRPLTDELHPSWQAKKMKQMIQPFQGKKIKFD